MPVLPTFCKTYPPELSQFIGEIGKREEFFIKFVDIRWIARLGSNVINIVDSNGNYGVYFSKEAPPGIFVGDCAVIKMTPKKQEISTFHQGKETTFSRIRLIENVGSKDCPKSVRY